MGYTPPPEMMQGINFLHDPFLNGKLPGGLSANDHGTLRIEKGPDVLPDGQLSQQFDFIRSGSSKRNYYFVVTENTNNNESQMTKAWSTDDSGKVIEQYPVQ